MYLPFFFTMTQAHRDLQLEPSSSDLTTQPLFNDSPVIFLETLDQVNAHPSEQVEQTEHTTPKKLTLLLILHMKYRFHRKDAIK